MPAAKFDITCEGWLKKKSNLKVYIYCTLDRLNKTLTAYEDETKQVPLFYLDLDVYEICMETHNTDTKNGYAFTIYNMVEPAQGATNEVVLYSSHEEEMRLWEKSVCDAISQTLDPTLERQIAMATNLTFKMQNKKSFKKSLRKRGLSFSGKEKGGKILFDSIVPESGTSSPDSVSISSGDSGDSNRRARTRSVVTKRKKTVPNVNLENLEISEPILHQESGDEEEVTDKTSLLEKEDKNKKEEDVQESIVLKDTSSLKSYKDDARELSRQEKTDLTDVDVLKHEYLGLAYGKFGEPAWNYVIIRTSGMFETYPSVESHRNGDRPTMRKNIATKFNTCALVNDGEYDTSRKGHCLILKSSSDNSEDDWYLVFNSDIDTTMWYTVLKPLVEGVIEEKISITRTSSENDFTGDKQFVEEKPSKDWSSIKARSSKKKRTEVEKKEAEMSSKDRFSFRDNANGDFSLDDLEKIEKMNLIGDEEPSSTSSLIAQQPKSHAPRFSESDLNDNDLRLDKMIDASRSKENDEETSIWMKIFPCCFTTDDDDKKDYSNHDGNSLLLIRRGDEQQQHAFL